MPAAAAAQSTPLAGYPTTVVMQVPDIRVPDAQKNLKKSLEKGILKILAK